MGVPKYIKHILTDIKGEVDSNPITVGNVDRKSIKKHNP